MKYSVYDYQFHFGMLFLIGNFIFFVCGKKKEQGQNIIYSLIVDKSFITQEDKELIQIIMPFGNGQIYKFRFNSQIKKNEFLLNIGYSNKFFDTYKLQREIGRGKFGVVWEGVKGRKMYAIKVFNKRGRFKLCRREVYINSFLMKHKHKQIVDIEEIYETGDTVYIVMEYIKDGDINENNIHAILEQYKYPLKASEKLLTQVINVIDYLHKYGIVHRDLKLDNILVTDISTLEIKLMDFGLATVINSDETIYEKCGTIIYAAPEIFNKTKYNRNIDLWNIGIIAYFLHFKQFPITKFKLKDINMALNKLIGVVDGISLNDLKENFLLQVIKSCLIKSQMLRKKCSVLLENYAQYINNKKNN
jgi:serine/threonine protein kinase